MLSETRNKIMRLFDHKETPEKNFVDTARELLAINQSKMTEIEGGLKKEVILELKRNMIEETAKKILEIVIEDNMRTCVMAILSDCATDSDKKIIDNFMGCRPLFYVFLLSYFAPSRELPASEAIVPSAMSLLAYRNHSDSKEAFQREIGFLYIFRVDETVPEELEYIQSTCKEMWDTIEKKIDDLKNNAPKKQKREKKDTHLVDFLTGNSLCEISIKSKCAVATTDSDHLLQKLMISIPYILENWDKLDIRFYVRIYQRISTFSEYFSPRTTIGLFVHFLYMTPAHLKLCIKSILNTI